MGSDRFGEKAASFLFSGYVALEGVETNIPSRANRIRAYVVEKEAPRIQQSSFAHSTYGERRWSHSVLV